MLRVKLFRSIYKCIGYFKFKDSILLSNERNALHFDARFMNLFFWYLKQKFYLFCTHPKMMKAVAIYMILFDRHINLLCFE